MVFFYTSTITTRLKYISDFVGTEIINGSFVITDDATAFSSYNGAKINYSNNRITEDEFWIQPHSILFEQNIASQDTACFTINNYKAFFKTEGDFLFDVFAASFYLLSRYEEYLPYQKDIYGRFAHENSLAYKEKFLQLPLVNIWLQEFSKKLNAKFSSFSSRQPKFSFIPTYDIDEAFSYKYKNFKRTAGGVVRSIFNGEWSLVKERIKVLTNREADPFDSFAWMDMLHKQYGLKPKYFFLLPDKKSKYDKNISPAKKELRLLIKEHAQKYEVGIHPSWQSGDDSSLIKKEIGTLSEIIDQTVTISRQHYIRFTLPQTLRYLIDTGIKEDHSMGYGSINGFRASVATPFYWYDLEKEEAKDLLLYPFCFMDANAYFEEKLSSRQALDEMKHYYNVVKKVNGTLVILWHNTFLGTDKKFEGWREVYESFVKQLAG